MIYDKVRSQWAAVTTSVKLKLLARNWQDRLCSFNELTTEQRVGLKEAESSGENIFGCQRIFDKYIQQGS